MDVYSYGVVVLEMITKRRPTNNIFVDGKSLPIWVQGSLHENWMDVIDPDLREQIQDNEQKALYSVLTLSVACAKDLPKDRPTMLDVLDALLLLKLGKPIQVEVDISHSDRYGSHDRGVDSGSDSTNAISLLTSGNFSSSL